MADITYEMIAANVANAKTNGSTVDIAWKCAATSKDMGRSTASMSMDHSMGGQVANSVKQSVIREMGYAVMNFVGKLIGGGAAGRVVRDATYTASNQVSSDVRTAAQYTESSKRAAIVEAFKSVADKYDWDEAKRQFIAKT